MRERAWPGIIARMAGVPAGQRAAESDEDDERLADAVRTKGDAQAFAVLVTRYRGRVLALARRMLGPGAAEEAEDAAQDAFLAAYEKRATFRPGEPFRPWLYRIVVNRCLDKLRARARRPQVHALDAVAEPSSDENPLRSVLQDEWETRLQEAVQDLEPRYRAVFLLRHLDDLSYEDIARATDLPLGTVKTHLFRAREKLRLALKGYFEP